MATPFGMATSFGAMITPFRLPLAPPLDMDITPKLILSVVGAAVWDRACVPPSRPSRPDQTRASERQLSLHEKVMALPVLPYWVRFAHWAFVATEAAALWEGRPQTFTLYSAAGTGLIILGASIRIRCFRELGRHFTLAMTLRDDHSLVTTGPYGVVRHPAYTGGLLQLLGALIANLGPGSWFANGGSATLWGKFLAVNLGVCAAVFGYACTRGAKEDRYLAKTFGETWERFAKNVPYRYIPGVC
ncbi:hypothetical protein B0H15DRAFT_890375 [Mycena belliarum]|uniref:Protein-S-isoprenylcysteine O-methyltransferase n=1 Tax=Mycena belliarum TaxID=1033014 RepID=A0AAD6TZQ6_9AGAR|nr:hypothetical protein B0H15DRAFT_890375 [Mycena belliae]